MVFGKAPFGGCPPVTLACVPPNPSAKPVVGPSIDDATLTFFRTIMESVTQPHPSQALALNAFSTAFQRWNPQSIVDIQLTDKATLDLLFATPPSTTANSNTYVPCYDNIVKGIIQQHQLVIENLVQNFNHTLTNGTLTKEVLQAACTALESSIWASYTAFCQDQHTTPKTSPFGTVSGFQIVTAPTSTSTSTGGGFGAQSASLCGAQSATLFGARPIAVGRFAAQPVPNISPQVLPLLPSIGTVKNEIDKLEDLKQTIKQYTWVFIHGKSYSLGDYNFPHCNYNGGTTTIDVTEKFCISALQQQLQNIQKAIGTIPNFLYWYAYFKHNSSILLPSKSITLPYVGNANSIFNINTSCSRIFDAFGPNMSYAGVGTAMQLLSNANDFNAEIKVLLNCEILKISALDVTNFRAVKLLHEIATPLQNFIQCCELHQFKVVDSDSSFRKLQAMVKEFYSKDSHDRNSCFFFFNRLHRILSTAEIDGLNTGTTVVEGSYIALLHKINYLKHVLPVQGLVPLTYVLHSSELRTYFREMKWIIGDQNNDGLQKFNEDYDKLTNILRRYEATDELTIVDSLKPVVQLFFYLERYCNCPSLHELVSKLNNDHDIQAFLQPTTTIQDDIHALTGRIYSIKGLFQNVCHLPPPLIVWPLNNQTIDTGIAPSPEVVVSSSGRPETSQTSWKEGKK